MYNPLPEEVTIKSSKIHGLGLFTTCDITTGHEFGITHVKHNNFLDGYIRTPLGGFMNHNVKPNCHRSQIRIKPGIDKWVITVVEDINPGEELTLKYEFYDPEKPI